MLHSMEQVREGPESLRRALNELIEDPRWDQLSETLELGVKLACPSRPRNVAFCSCSGSFQAFRRPS